MTLHFHDYISFRSIEQREDAEQPNRSFAAKMLIILPVSRIAGAYVSIGTASSPSRQRMSNSHSFVLFGYTSSIIAGMRFAYAVGENAALAVKTLIHPQAGRFGFVIVTERGQVQLHI